MVSNVSRNTQMTQIILTESDNGASFSVKKNDSILLRLEENPTTGYRWKFVEDTDFISFESTKFLMPEDPEFGQGGNRLFVFKNSQGLALSNTFQIFR